MVALIKCLLVLRCQLYMFRTVTVHPQELLCRYCMCRLWYVLIRPAGTTFYTIEFLIFFFCVLSPFEYCILLYYTHNALILYVLSLATCVRLFIFLMLFLIFSVEVLLTYIACQLTFCHMYMFVRCL